MDTHETKSPWPLLHFKHSHWWKRRSRSKFASHYLRLRDQRSMWVQDGGCKGDMVSYEASNGSCFMVTLLDCFQNSPLGGRPNTKPGDHGTLNARNLWFYSFIIIVWGFAWIEIHWNGIWLRTRSHMTSHYSWGSMTTLHIFGGVLGRPFKTFFWALTISWSRLLARVWKWPLGVSNLESHVFFPLTQVQKWMSTSPLVQSFVTVTGGGWNHKGISCNPIILFFGWINP
jgi:hypothetical protein